MSNISVLHINYYDNMGGSGRSAYKIHTGIQSLGCQSKMLVRKKVTDNDDVDLIRRGIVRVADKVAHTVTEAVGLQYVYLPSSWHLRRHAWYRQADVIQLYNTHSNLFSHSALPRISREKKVVWRLSDMWPMTGHCAYNGSCDKWMTGCRGCPDLAAYPPLKWDTAGLLWKYKKRLYDRSNVHVVAPSQWILDVSDRSPLFAEFSKSLIRNGVDCEMFQPQAKQQCREDLGIPQGKKAILFLAHAVTEARKGGEFFVEAIQRMCQDNAGDFVVLLVGVAALDWQVDLPCQVWRHDLIEDDRQLARVYNAADVIVHPATDENLPNSVLEAMACGVPAVGFDVGGVGEPIEHHVTGALAEVRSSEQLAEGIRWVLDCDQRWRHLSNRCRRRIEDEYSLAGQARSFDQLYRELVHPQIDHDQKTAAA